MRPSISIIRRNLVHVGIQGSVKSPQQDVQGPGKNRECQENVPLRVDGQGVVDARYRGVGFRQGNYNVTSRYLLQIMQFLDADCTYPSLNVDLALSYFNLFVHAARSLPQRNTNAGAL